MTEYQKDCIHLKACRRLQKLTKKNYGVQVARYCTPDCTAYETESGYSAEQMYKAIRGACRDGANGYDPYDLCIEDYL